MDVDLVDGMIMLGLVLLGVGLGAYDWRLALVVCGALLFVVGLVTGWRRAAGPESDG